MDKILISVIVPAYNEEKFIAACILSLEKQNFNKDDYEVIIIDNGSTDNTAKIVKNFNVKLIHESKKGISYALNRGILEAKGRIVAVTNADSVVSSNWVSNIYSAFKNNSNAAIVSGRLILIPSNFLSYMGELFINFAGGFVLKNIVGPNFAIKKDIFCKVGGLKENINFNCETELFLRIKKNKGTAVFLWSNPVITSSRHFKGFEGIKYCARGLISSVNLLFFKKATFVYMVDVR